jgi:hypothetical protein
MSRIARLLPLSLGVLFACDGAGPTAVAPDDATLELQDAALAVEIDVQPLGSASNILNLHARSGQVRVAVLSAVTVLGDGTVGVDFDPSRVDYATVTFLGAAEIHVEPVEPGPNCAFPASFAASHYADVNLDLVDDALFHFAASDLVLPPDTEDGAAVNVCISGRLIDEDPTDAVPPVAFEGCADAMVRF